MTAPIRSTISPLHWFWARLSRSDDGPRFQHVLEQLPSAAFLIAPRAGAFITVNSRALALTGWGREDLLARTLAEIITGPTALQHAQAVYTLQPGQVRQLYNAQLRGHAGRMLDVDMRLSAISEVDQNETLVLLLATPVEERLTQEREALQRTRMLELMGELSALPGESFLNTALGLIREALLANAIGYWQVTAHAPGLELAENLNVPEDFPRHLAPSDLAHFETPLQWSSYQRGHHFVYRAARAAGWSTLLTHPVGEGNALVGIIFIGYRGNNPPTPQTPTLLAVAARQLHHLQMQMTRATELANTHHLITRLAQHLAALSAQMEEGALVLNANGTIEEINLAATRLLGYRAEEVIGLPYTDVVVASDVLHSAVQRLTPSAPPDELEDTVHRRNGEAFPARLKARLLPHGGCLLTVRDVSQERANAVHREHLDQLAYAGQATQSFAHEVRGPLNNIAMGVQYLAARLPADETTQSALTKIQAECNRLSDLMRDMLAWAKPIDPRLAPTDLAQLLQRLLNRWSHKMQQRNVRLVFHTEAPLPRIAADARMLEQVFVNLIDNALQAMLTGGQLSVSARPVHRAAQGAVIEISIADTGPGIPEEARRRIFDPYFTTKPDGTGLGLAICKRIVTVHRGALAVDSFPGTGTVFTVTLPTLEETAGLEVEASDENDQGP